MLHQVKNFENLMISSCFLELDDECSCSICEKPIDANRFKCTLNSISGFIETSYDQVLQVPLASSLICAVLVIGKHVASPQQRSVLFADQSVASQVHEIHPSHAFLAIPDKIQHDLPLEPENTGHEEQCLSNFPF